MHQLQTEIESICAAAGTHLIELAMRGDKRRPVVEVYVDSEEGVDLATCGTISSKIDVLLASVEGFSEQYRLNVSSPGVDRPMKALWQLRKHIGRTLIVTLGDGEKIRAVLADVTEDGLKLEAAGRKKKSTTNKEVANLKETQELAQENFQSAVVEIAW